MKDSRTDLPDRDSFYEDADRFFADGATTATPLVLLCIDVGGVDLILRTFGPFDRDALLREIGRRIREAVPETTDLYHITQARFALPLRRLSYRQARQTAKRIIEALSEPFYVRSIPHHVRPYIGIGCAPNHAGDISELVRASVAACEQARGNPRLDYAIFDPDRDAHERARFHLMADLGRAMEEGDQLHMAYQPHIDLRTGCCVGAEVLCRWNHPTRGWIPPATFVPFVEHTTLMMPFTELTLAKGLADLPDVCDGFLAVNLSPVLFRNPSLRDRVMDKLRFFNVPGHRLCLEVTETGIVDEPARAVETLEGLRARNIAIAVDDFGTGHSSLADLANLPVDRIKIDRYFVQNLDKRWAEAIVGASATLAATLGMTTVAEGIEDAAQLRRCRELGVDIGQGFYLARPMFKSDFKAW